MRKIKQWLKVFLWRIQYESFARSLGFPKGAVDCISHEERIEHGEYDEDPKCVFAEDFRMDDIPGGER